MKNTLRKIVLFLLKGMAKRRMRKFKGKVITVTGSIGKTSTKDAIYAVLNTQLKVKRSKKSMNSEFGMLLTILDLDSGYSSVLKWTGLLTKGFYNSFFQDHSDILLLELGVDKVGDMDFLTSIIKSDIAIMTNISPVHLAEGQFSTLDDIFTEKSKLVKKLKEGAIAILNGDDNYISNLQSQTKAKVIKFGVKPNAEYIINAQQESTKGICFNINTNKETTQINAKVLGLFHTHILTPAFICGELMKIKKELIIKALEKFTLPPGRMSILPGKNNSTILDSTYNSSPFAVTEALKTLKLIGKDSRKIAILGNMNELGTASQELHKIIGETVPQYADMLLTVGKDAKYISQKAIENGMDKDLVHHFSHTPKAIKFFQEIPQENDIILVKGSQNKIRLERLVESILLIPEDKSKLVRQEKEWKFKI